MVCSLWKNDRRFSRVPLVHCPAKTPLYGGATCMGFYLLYDHLDHLFDELAFAQRTHRNVHAYVKLHEQR